MREWKKWLLPGLKVKRWLLALAAGFCLLSAGILIYALKFIHATVSVSDISWHLPFLGIISGAIMIVIAVIKFAQNLLEPYRRHRQDRLIDVVYQHRQRNRGLKFVAIGGGTGLPVVLRGMKIYTGNITAIVTVADDGGSSGRLRRELGVLPPGDLRNNIAALANDESLLARLFQYRFETGDLSGHAFGNLFIAALANVVNSSDSVDRSNLAEALVEIERVLNIQGRVLPSTLDDVTLRAVVRIEGTSRAINVLGESKIGETNGMVERVYLNPPDATAFPESVQAILDADVIAIGPGSLYTSILPNLMVKGIADALRATHAYKIYICNVATQPVETIGYTVAEHVMALERHIGRGVFQAILANNRYPEKNRGVTEYVQTADPNHEILQRYEARYTDLTDDTQPWRHDPQKLARAILELSNQERIGEITSSAII